MSLKECHVSAKQIISSLNITALSFQVFCLIKCIVFFVGGDEWMLLAERMGLNSERIRFLDRRYPNPAGALLDYVGERSDMTVGNLYDLFNECGLPGLADRL